MNTRICRPAGLTLEEVDTVVAYAVSRLGHMYDLRNIIDLARYLIRTPSLSNRWRRRLLTLGSGDPTRAICSSLITQAFQSIGYPILPDIVFEHSNDPACVDCYEEMRRIRHHSLFTPRDFDVSPYFQIVKPALYRGFDRRKLAWVNNEGGAD
jgi:hypothetical protein